jgi:hypothetical protein
VIVFAVRRHSLQHCRGRTPAAPAPRAIGAQAHVSLPQASRSAYRCT